MQECNFANFREKNQIKKLGDDFGLISNPEFLQESNAIKEYKISTCSSTWWLSNKIHDKSKEVSFQNYIQIHQS